MDRPEFDRRTREDRKLESLPRPSIPSTEREANTRQPKRILTLVERADTPLGEPTLLCTSHHGDHRSASTHERTGVRDGGHPESDRPAQPKADFNRPIDR